MSIVLAAAVTSFLTINGASYHFSPPDEDSPSGRKEWNELNYGLGFEMHGDLGVAMIGTLKDSNENPMHYFALGPSFQLTDSIDVDIPVGMYSRVFYDYKGDTHRGYKIVPLPRVVAYNNDRTLGVAAYFLPMEEADAVFLQVLVRWD